MFSFLLHYKLIYYVWLSKHSQATFKCQRLQKGNDASVKFLTHSLEIPFQRLAMRSNWKGLKLWEMMLTSTKSLTLNLMKIAKTNARKDSSADLGNSLLDYHCVYISVCKAVYCWDWTCQIPTAFSPILLRIWSILNNQHI